MARQWKSQSKCGENSPPISPPAYRKEKRRQEKKHDINPSYWGASAYKTTKEGGGGNNFRFHFTKEVEGIDKPHVGLLPVSRGRNETLRENCRLEVLGLFLSL